MNEVLVVSESHPNEASARRIARTLLRDPIPNVTLGAANIRASVLGQRLVDMNLANAFGHPGLPAYEPQRANMLEERCRRYRHVLDIHDTSGPGGTAGFVGGEIQATGEIRVKPVDLRMLGCLGRAGVEHMVVSDFDSIQKHIPNAVMLELEKEAIDTRFDEIAQDLRTGLDQLANSLQPPMLHAEDFQWYQFLDNLHADQVPYRELNDVEAFTSLSEEIAHAMGYSGQEICLLNWLTTGPNKQGYWGEVAVPIPTPDDTMWPEE